MHLTEAEKLVIIECVEVVYSDNQNLNLLESDQEAHKTRLPQAVIKSFRSKINIIKNAPDERTLRNWKALRLEKMQGGKYAGQNSIRLNDQWRLLVLLEGDRHPPRITILSIEDYH